MGRNAKPWYRAARDGWFVTIAGRVVNLRVSGKGNEANAWQAFSERLQSSVAGDSVRGRLDEFLDTKRLEGVSGKTVDDYGRALDWLAEKFPDASVDKLDAKAIQGKALQESWSNSHRANILTVIQAFIRWTGRDQFRIVRPSKPSRGAKSVIQPDVWERILRETRGDFHQLLRVLWETGARPSEIAGLTVDAVQWGTKTAIPDHHKTAHKGKRRVIFFNDIAMTVLNEQAAKYAGKGLLFRSLAGDAFNAHSIGVRFQRLETKINAKVTAYGIRHTWATRALTQGHSDSLVAVMMGHADTRMIHKHYSHIGADAKLMLAIANAVK